MLSYVVGLVDRERSAAIHSQVERRRVALDCGGRRCGLSCMATQQGGAGSGGGDADVRDSVGDRVSQQECEASVRAAAPHSVAGYQRSRHAHDVLHISGPAAAGRFSPHSHLSACAPALVHVGAHLDGPVRSRGASP